MELNVKGALPAFLIVTIWVGIGVCPTVTVPNGRLVWFSETAGVPPPLVPPPLRAAAEMARVPLPPVGSAVIVHITSSVCPADPA